MKRTKVCDDLDFIGDLRMQAASRICKTLVFTSKCAGVCGCSTPRYPYIVLSPTASGIEEAWHFSALGATVTYNGHKEPDLFINLHLKDREAQRHPPPPLYSPGPWPRQSSPFSFFLAQSFLSDP